jgi:hypothetical protein
MEHGRKKERRNKNGEKEGINDGRLGRKNDGKEGKGRRRK